MEDDDISYCSAFKLLLVKIFYSFTFLLFKKHKEFIVEKDKLEINQNLTLESFKGSFSAYPQPFAGLPNGYPFH